MNVGMDIWVPIVICSQCDTGFIMDKVTHLCEGERISSTFN